MAQDKLWTKNFIVLSAINFFMFLVFYILLTVLPLYMVEILHEKASNVGLAFSVFFISAIIIRPFAGRWMGRGLEKKALIYSAFCLFLAVLFYPLVNNIQLLLVLRIFHGLTFGVITTAKGTICAEIIPASRLGEGLSFYSMAMSIGMIIGPLIGIYLTNLDAYNIAFILCMIVSAITILLVSFVRVPERIKDREANEGVKKFTWHDLFDENAVPSALATFILAFAWSGVLSFLALFAKEIGLIKTAGNFFTIYAVSILICRPFTGRWADKYGKGIIVYPCLIIFAAGLFLLSKTHTGGILLLAGALIGIGYGSVTPILQTQTISSVEPHRIGTANSMFFNSMDGGIALGAYVLGNVAGFVGYRSVFMVGFALIVLAGIEYFALTRVRKRKSPNLT